MDHVSVCLGACQVLWTGRPCRNFHLLLCIAVLVSEKTILIQNNFGFTEILKVCAVTHVMKLYLQCACDENSKDIFITFYEIL